MFIMGLSVTSAAMAAQTVSDNQPIVASDRTMTGADMQTASALDAHLQSTPAANARANVLGGSSVVTVRDPNLHLDPNRTFQGWWKND
jgi:hypothetical protein